MKKINFIWAILFCTVASMLFISCEKQQDASEAILGTWYLNSIAYKYYEDGETDQGQDYAGNMQFDFTPDGKFVMHTTYEDGEGPSGYNFYYEIDGNRIYTSFIQEWFGEDLEYVRIKRLTSTEMIWLFEASGTSEWSEYKMQYLLKFSR